MVVEELTISFIGGGTMAEAMLSGILEGGLATSSAIAVGEPLAARRDYLSGRYGVKATPENLEAIRGAHLVVLAVKPQQMEAVMKELRGHLDSSQAVLSIVAGATLRSMSRGLEHLAIIRVMPNTPAQVAEGMSVWTAAPEVSTRQREVAQGMLKALGEEMYVSEEKYLDMATALSASGPAYVFLFLEALIDAGVYLGLTRDMAQTLATQTVLGSATLAKKSGRHPVELRNMGHYHQRRHRRPREGHRPGGGGVMSYVLQLVNALITFLSLAIFGRIILDWLIVGGIMRQGNPLREAMIRITEPILAPIRRYAHIGMIDLSPMVAIIILMLIQQALASLS
ncbi:MAG: pyrroline-5-carboxylate reductase [Dehalococcoidia bacterium]|nr:pyrroline-5-carboxylate reductase [Dehalococcoidia bacterium]